MSNDIQTIPFHGQTIQAAMVDGKPNVALKPMCENLGVDYEAQYKRLRRQPWATISIMEMVAADGKNREMSMIDRRTFTMWLATIDTSRLKNEATRQLIVTYQNEAADALDEYFNEGAAIRLQPGDTEDDIIAKGMLAAGRKIEQLKTRLTQVEAESEKRGQQLAIAHDTLGSIARLLDQQKPYAAIGSQFVQLDGTIGVREVSRNFQQIDPTMTMTRVFQLLRQNGYIEKHSNAPTMKGIKPGYLCQRIGKKHNGDMAKPYSVFTAKGVGWFISRFIYQQPDDNLDVPTLY